MNKIQEYFILRKLKPTFKEFEKQAKKYFNESLCAINYDVYHQDNIIWGKILTNLDVETAWEMIDKMDREWFFKLNYKYKKYFNYNVEFKL